jgi:hypothetical protein
MYYFLKLIKKEKYQDIEKYGLTSTLWKLIGRHYKYESDNPILKDFLNHLFQNRFLFQLNHESWMLNREASIFVNHWMDSAKYQVISLQDGVGVSVLHDPYTL